jgi:hypothetical protein
MRVRPLAAAHCARLSRDEPDVILIAIAARLHQSEGAFVDTFCLISPASVATTVARPSEAALCDFAGGSSLGLVNPSSAAVSAGVDGKFFELNKGFGEQASDCNICIRSRDANSTETAASAVSVFLPAKLLRAHRSQRLSGLKANSARMYHARYRMPGSADVAVLGPGYWISPRVVRRAADTINDLISKDQSPPHGGGDRVSQ